MSLRKVNKPLATGIILLFIAGLFSSIYLPSRGLATILFQDGFEGGNTDAWDYVGGTVDVGTENVFTGTYSANITSTVGIQDHYVTHDLVDENPVFFGAQYYFKSLSFPSEVYPDIAQLKIMEIGTDGAKGIEILVRKTPFSGTGYCWRIQYIDAYSYNWDDDELGYDSSYEPSAGNWFGIEISWNHTGGNTGTAVWITTGSGTKNIWDAITTDPYSTVAQWASIGAWSYYGTLTYTFKTSFDDCSIGDAYTGIPAVGEPTPDTSPPEFLDGNPYLETNTLTWNTSLAGELCSVSVNATDNVALSGYFLSYRKSVV